MNSTYHTACTANHLKLCYNIYIHKCTSIQAYMWQCDIPTGSQITHSRIRNSTTALAACWNPFRAIDQSNNYCSIYYVLCFMYVWYTYIFIEYIRLLCACMIYTYIYIYVWLSLGKKVKHRMILWSYTLCLCVCMDAYMYKSCMVCTLINFKLTYLLSLAIGVG